MENNWKEQLKAMIPLLGHRNWIVVTDMAYPLQSGHGITTLFAPESFETVIADVAGMIAEAPHVFAHTYLDSEQLKIDDSLVDGWSDYRKRVTDALAGSDVSYIAHEELIARLDNVGKLFNTVIIKTPLTKPYTSVFFELDCGYWDPEREGRLRRALAAEAL